MRNFGPLASDSAERHFKPWAILAIEALLSRVSAGRSTVLKGPENFTQSPLSSSKQRLSGCPGYVRLLQMLRHLQQRTSRTQSLRTFISNSTTTPCGLRLCPISLFFWAVRLQLEYLYSQSSRIPLLRQIPLSFTQVSSALLDSRLAWFLASTIQSNSCLLHLITHRKVMNLS